MRGGALLSKPSAGDTADQSNVGDGTVMSMDGESAGVLAKVGSVADKSDGSCGLPSLLWKVGDDGEAGIDLRRPTLLWRPENRSAALIIVSKHSSVFVDVVYDFDCNKTCCHPILQPFLCCSTFRRYHLMQ